MSEIENYSLEEAHKMFARTLNAKTWGLLETADRSQKDDELMVHSAHTSNYHWLQVGTGLHHQRGEWLIARVYSVLGIADAALRHAKRCLELTEAHAELMKDFDKAFAFEGAARANAVAGNKKETKKYNEMAEKAGEKIKDAEDKKYFFEDLKAGNWNNLK